MAGSVVSFRPCTGKGASKPSALGDGRLAEFLPYMVDGPLNLGAAGGVRVQEVRQVCIGCAVQRGHADADQIVKDQQRDTYFQALGLHVIRYCNDDIMKNLDGVLVDLTGKISSEATSPGPSLRRRGQETEC